MLKDYVPAMHNPHFLLFTIIHYFIYKYNAFLSFFIKNKKRSTMYTSVALI